MEKLLSYISLFSSAGVGCYGFKLEGFECIATNELIERRLNIQKYNHKCKYDSGYICGDITNDETKKLLYNEIRRWEKNDDLKKVDVVIATPPCQGMSVANHKKTDTEIIRNSLVVESIKLIKDIQPNFFIFENVPSFMKTICTDVDGIDKPISEAIRNDLGQMYSYAYKIINFKNYGACSSRQRTLVIGVLNDYANQVSPLELYPDMSDPVTLRDVIGDMPSLTKMGEVDDTDIYHAFRPYPEYMREWISDLKEGESAFDQTDPQKRPHQIIDGKMIENKQKNGDKYRRQIWDKTGPCIHTRNDQLASQNTIHPSDDRVFSIRELMRMMTVPDDFAWTDIPYDELNNLPDDEKRKFLKKEETKIRQSLGEAVPTEIFRRIAVKMAVALQCKPLKTSEINQLFQSAKLDSADDVVDFIHKNSDAYSFATLCRIAELANTKREETSAYFTDKKLVTEIIKNLPDTNKESIRILEPSVGVGNFVPLIVEKYKDKQLTLDLMDIDADSLKILQALMELCDFPENVQINYICDDFLLHDFSERYDYVIGNPPFGKMKPSDKKLKLYKSHAVNNETRNICSFFLEKAMQIGEFVSLVFPKFLLNTPEFRITREELSKKAVKCIIDFGENGFRGVLIETIAIFISNKGKPGKTKVVSMTNNQELNQKQSYIFDKSLPYWIIYRDNMFDEVCKKLDFGVFRVFRDRQITNKMLHDHGDIRVLKSRNITDDSIINVPGYDSYIDKKDAEATSVYKYLDNDEVYLTPNMTYNPRMIRKPKNCLVNGSVAILTPVKDITITDEQLQYFASKEYRRFYRVARNYQTRSLNVDETSIYFYGLLKNDGVIQHG